MDKHILDNHESNKQCEVCDSDFRNIEELSRHKNNTHKNNGEPLVTCKRCGMGLCNTNDLMKHLATNHHSYKPCTKFATNSYDADFCRFNHIKLQPKEEICFKCGKKFMSKTDIMNHIKAQHGKEVCHRFLRNECSRSSENCIFSHNTTVNVNQSQPLTQQPDFRERPIPQHHSPGVGLHTMSEHLQNKQQLQGPHSVTQLPQNLVNLIPHIVAQVVAILNLQTKQ